MPQPTLKLILFAEDNTNDIALCKRSIEKNNLAADVRFVRDGEQVIDWMSGTGPYADRAQYPFPDILVTDISMDKISGLELLKWVRQQPDFKDMPVIMHSSSAHPAASKAAEHLQVDQYIVKQAWCDELIVALKKLL